MSASVLRIPRWFGNPRSSEDGNASAASPRLLARQKMVDDIGDFIILHDLEISDRSLAVVHAFFNGDRDVEQRIEENLRAHGGLNDAAIAEIAERASGGLGTEKLSGIADQVNDKLIECLKIIGQSSAHARDYGAAITTEAAGFQADPLGTVERLLALTRDVAERSAQLEDQLDHAQKEAQRLRSHLTQARREADHDHLTGLPNRRSFEFRLAALPVDPAGQPPMCIALCDIDRFKAINDQHGHDTGDRVLRYFARRLRDALAGHAVVARYGGEEFVCLFENSSVEEAADRLDAIREAFAAKPLVNKTTKVAMPPLTFSVGIARIAGEPRHALTGADNALYDAKRTGRNRILVGTAAP